MFQSRRYTHEADPTHQAILRKPGQLEWFVGKNLRVAPEPGNRQIREDADDRVRHAVQCNTAPENRRIGVEMLTPKTLSHHHDVAFVLFFWQKIATENRMDAKQFELVSSHVAAE